ncbi:MAG: signal peptidase I [Actinomycetota bacterium]
MRPPAVPRQSLPRLGWLCAAGLALTLPASWSSLRLGVVTGHSMEPTMRSGQPFVFERSVEPDRLKRGDVVVVRMGGHTCIKRVYALGSDRFWSVAPPGRAGSLFGLVAVGDPVDLWKARYPKFVYEEWRVPSRCVFVVGDASSQSVDSRQLGPVPMSQVVGRVVWPQEQVAPAGGPVSYWADRPPRPHSKAHRAASQS